MKAAAYNPKLKESSCLETIEVEKPILTNNNAIVKVRAVGVCGSDLLKLDRSLVKPGTILGHEMVGVIEEISEQASLKCHFKLGDRIVSSHHVPCLECDYCLRGKESLCTQFKNTNFNPGAFCEYLELSEGHLKHTVQKVPEYLTDLEASFTEPVACCIKAVRHPERSEGSNANISMRHLVIGLGSIGLIIGQLLKHYYPEDEVCGLDLDENRLKLAESFNISRHYERTLCHPEQREGPNAKSNARTDPLDPSPAAQDDSYDSIFLCAGANATVDLAIKHARNGATITVFSSTPGETSFSNNEIYYKELTIKGSYSPNLENLKEALKLISTAKIKVNKLISHKTSLDKLGETIEKAKEEKGIKVLLEF